MLSRLPAFRPDDRRDAVIGFVTLVGVMAGHSVLETARDTLFLARLPAHELPWAYISIALLSLLVTGYNRGALLRFSRRRVLSLSLFGGALVTAAFWWVGRAGGGAPVLFAVYVWTGVLATVVVVQFWLLASEVFDVGQAKRVFAFIGAGGLVGAALGSALAGAALYVLPPRALLLVAAGLFALTAPVPLRFSRGRSQALKVRRREIPRGFGVSLLGSEPYLRRLFWVTLVSTVLVTGVDFVFKAMVSVDVAPDQLGFFFARFYAVMNVLALVVQLVIAPRLLSGLGVNGSLLLLPALLLAGSVGFVATLGLGAVLMLRAADGALRHSVNRTGTEILYFPLPPGLRDRFKAVNESVGQRGGQAVASVLLLISMVLGAKPTHIGIALAAFAALWLVAIYGLKPHYLELFRRNLREGTIETQVDVPELDLHSLEALMSALSSENDDEVNGALDLLAAYGKTNLIPALILYHPSQEIVLRAFELLGDSNRGDVRRLTARLLKHENPRIRAAALRAICAQDPDVRLLHQMMEDESPLVRTTAMVQLIRSGSIDEFEGGDLLRSIIDGDSPEMRLALAFAARDLPAGRYSWALIRLAGVREPGIEAAVAQSMAAAPDHEFVPTLVRLLAHRESREDARVAILSLGDDALDALEKGMDDPALPRQVRRHLPRTISRFQSSRAVQVLLRKLTTEKDEVVVLKILRGLGRLRTNDPTLRVNRRQLTELARVTLQRAVTMLYWRVLVETTSERMGADTAAADLLTALLADKEANALERVFRILQIMEPTEEFRIMYTGLRSSDRRVRATSRELLANVVDEPLRTGLVALVEEMSEPERLREASRFFSAPGCEELPRVLAELDSPDPALAAAAAARLERLHILALRDMLLDPSDPLSSVASYRVAELNVDELLPALGEREPRGEGAFVRLSDSVVGMIRVRQGATGASSAG